MGGLHGNKGVVIQAPYVIPQFDVFPAFDYSHKNLPLLQGVTALSLIDGYSPSQFIQYEFPDFLRFPGDNSHLLAGVDTFNNIIDGKAVQYHPQ